MASNNPGPSQAARSNRLMPISTPRTAVTPNANRREPTSARPSASARRNNNNNNNVASTPHARAARRAMDQRRAALFTPGRARRRSVREERETPRDILRNLSRILAPKTQVVSTSSSPESAGQQQDDSAATLQSIREDAGESDEDDDFPIIERPRFSLALGGMIDDDDDEDLKPPRLSGFEEENFTLQSIEMARRADNTLTRFDRTSLGSTRFSDYMGPDIQSDNVGIDSGFFPPPADFGESEEVVMEEPPTIERLDANDARRQTLGADSVFGTIEIPDAANETTFMIEPVESPEHNADPTETAGIEGIDDNDDGDDQDGPLLDMNHDDDDDDDDDHINEPMDLPDWDGDSGPENEPDRTELNTVGESVSLGTSDLTNRATGKVAQRKRGKKMSRHGIEYTSLPSIVVKRLATTLARTAGNKGKLKPDTLEAIMQASDWFFEQLGDDLSAYAKHAGRKTIDESDMVTLMRRQRQTNASTTPFALAQRHLPRELLQELRMPVPVPSKGPRRKSRRIEVDADEEVT
ncbi:hypothetical protein F5Y17DRAFT_49829 [Xylariaceae sp. FL0594]|nr:hypothetical protein F5Y17DRAFT_49829 [Xylariaceae sp. FL0594]